MDLVLTLLEFLFAMPELCRPTLLKADFFFKTFDEDADPILIIMINTFWSSCLISSKNKISRFLTHHQRGDVIYLHTNKKFVVTLILE